MRWEMLLWMARQYMALVAWCARRLGAQATAPAARPAQHRARGRNWTGYLYTTRRVGPYTAQAVLFMAAGPRDFGDWGMTDFRPTMPDPVREVPFYAESPSPRTYPRARIGIRA